MPGYEGAYERHLKAQGKMVNMVSAEGDAAAITSETNPASPARARQEPAKGILKAAWHQGAACPPGCQQPHACAFIGGDQEEHPETLQNPQFFAFAEANAAPPAKGLEHETRFQHLMCADAGGQIDLQDVETAFRQLTSQVSIGPKPSQAKQKGP